jgi:hypothetical protein
MGASSAGWPRMWTTSIALGIARPSRLRRSSSATILSAERFHEVSSASTRVSAPPWYETGLAEAMKVIVEQKTSSPRSMPASRMATCKAAVPLAQATAYLAPT